MPVKWVPVDGSACPEVDDRGMREVYSEYGGSYGVSIRLRMPRDYESTVDSGYLQDAVRVLNAGMRTGTAQLDPETAKRASKIETDMRNMFWAAGLGSIFVERLPNTYWPEAYAYERMQSPWFTITTSLGHFEVGWRKRVIHIGWERTVLGPKFDLVSRGEVTHDPGFCHAYGYEDGAKVLRELREAAESLTSIIGQPSVPELGWRRLSDKDEARPGDVFFGSVPYEAEPLIHPVNETVRVGMHINRIYFRKIESQGIATLIARGVISADDD